MPRRLRPDLDRSRVATAGQIRGGRRGVAVARRAGSRDAQARLWSGRGLTAEGGADDCGIGSRSGTAGVRREPHSCVAEVELAAIDVDRLAVRVAQMPEDANVLLMICVVGDVVPVD